MRKGKRDTADDPRSPFPQVNGVDPQHYRPNRKLSPAERARLAAEYLSGKSAVELAREFKLHRETVARHVEREGVAVRPQLKMTPWLVEQAKQHYAEGHSLAEATRCRGEHGRQSPQTRRREASSASR